MQKEEDRGMCGLTFKLGLKGLWPYCGRALPTSQAFRAVGSAWELPHPVSIEQLQITVDRHFQFQNWNLDAKVRRGPTQVDVKLGILFSRCNYVHY